MNQPKPLIVITGASSGIGKECAQAFSQAGHPLLLLARRIERLQELNLPRTMTAQVDIKDRKAIQQAVEAAQIEYGPVDALINNAGVMLLSEVATQDPEQWDQMIDTNIKGILNATHFVLPTMVERKQGTIINISSVAGRKTFPNHAVYCATKFAVHALTENLREEVANQNVRIITIAPGAVETELLSHTTSSEIKDGYENWKESIGGALTTDSIVNCIKFAYEQPQSTCIREIVVAATGQQP